MVLAIRTGKRRWCDGAGSDAVARERSDDHAGPPAAAAPRTAEAPEKRRGPRCLSSVDPAIRELIIIISIETQREGKLREEEETAESHRTTHTLYSNSGDMVVFVVVFVSAIDGGVESVTGETFTAS